MPRERVNKVTVTGPITLDDLRWLVAQCEGQSGGSKVTVLGRRDHGQFDVDLEEITVHGADHLKEEW